MQPEQNPNYWQAPVEQPSSEEPAVEQIATPASQPEEVVSRATEALTWQASEYVHHEKGGTWFLALLGVATVLLLIDIFLIKSWTFGALIAVMTAAVIVFARRPPRILDYTLSSQGIRIDEKLFSFHDFRAFGVVQENAFYSIRLIPNKRFMPMVSVYFPAEQGEQIVDIFGSFLPMEHIELDPIDKLVEKIRF